MAFGDFTVTRASEKRVLGSAGTLVTYANNEPAFEWNADGTFRGLSVEPGATNLALRSEDFTTTWSNQGLTDTANTTVAPDGATTADTVTGNGTDTTVYIQQNITFAGAGTYTFSCWAKAGTHDIIRVNIANYVGSTSTITGYDLTNGTTTEASNPITAYPNGWYRLSFTFTVVGGDLAGQIRIFLSPSTGTTAWTLASDSDTKSVILWGAQLETGSVATSYIPTVASTATRTADAVTLTGASSLIGQTEGAMYVEVEPRINAVSRLFLAVTSSPDVAGSRLRLGITAANALYGQIGGTITNTITATATIYKMLLNYSASGFTVHTNGTSYGTAVTATTGTKALINIGSLAAPGNYLNGWIRSVAFFPSALTTAQANSLTTL